MSDNKTLTVPDLGDFSAVEIIEVLVSEGDALAPEDPVVTLETDKATMDIPATEAGIVSELLVAVGDRVSQGDPVLHYRAQAGAASASPAAPAAQTTDDTVLQAAPAAAAAPAPAPAGDATHTAELVVIGAGPGG